MTINQSSGAVVRTGGIKKAIAIFTIFVSVLSFGGVALAEGSWQSNITGALTGFTSRDWTDKNLDAANTVIRFDNCVNVNLPAGNLADVDVELRKNNNNWPDESKGTKNLPCHNTSSKSWGDVASGTYFFKINKIDGQSSGGRLNVGSVRVTY